MSPAIERWMYVREYLPFKLSAGFTRRGTFIYVSLQRAISGPNSRPSLCLAPPGLRGVALAQSVATDRGRFPVVESAEIEKSTTSKWFGLAGGTTGPALRSSIGTSFGVGNLSSKIHIESVDGSRSLGIAFRFGR